MPATFISEPVKPLESSFDTAGMARGEPGLPHKFRWRKKEYVVAEVLDQGRQHGSCAHGSGERYVRRHTYRVRTEDGTLFKIYFQRSFGRARPQARRWWISSVEANEGQLETRVPSRP